MRIARVSSIEEYARWYLQRNLRKHPGAILDDSYGPVGVVRGHHQGKMRVWFGETTQWHIVLLDQSDLGNLVFLECDWTKEKGLVIPNGQNYRLLKRVADNAITRDYLQQSSTSNNPLERRHKEYYDRLAAGSLRLEGDDRIAICSAEESEIRSNPDAQYYLLDGAGRCLPYMILVIERRLEFSPVEAFLATR